MQQQKNCSTYFKYLEKYIALRARGQFGHAEEAETIYTIFQQNLPSGSRVGTQERTDGRTQALLCCLLRYDTVSQLVHVPNASEELALSVSKDEHGSSMLLQHHSTHLPCLHAVLLRFTVMGFLNDCQLKVNDLGI
jgi:hypothetical protein